MVGSWIQQRGKRDDFYLFSKVSGRNQAASIGHRDATTGLTRENIFTAVDMSLARLHTDYLDLYQVHVPDRDTTYFGKRAYDHIPQTDGVAIEETLTALSDVVKAGKVRHVGVSNESAWGLSEYLRLSREKGLEKIVSIQNQYSLLQRTVENQLAEICYREQIGFLAYSVLSMGALTGKYLDGAQPAGARMTLYERNKNRYNPAHAQEHIRGYVAIAKKHGLDPAQMAIAFCLTKPFIASVILGATTVEQLATDIAAADITLSPECLADIDAYYKAVPDPLS
jgi:aryl-alcohol dehydrogenase-like predicted oxidoreductase